MENKEGLKLLMSLSERGKKIMIHHPFSDNELRRPGLGSSRLVVEEIKTLREKRIFGGTITKITKTHSLLRNLNTQLAAHRQLGKVIKRMQRVRAIAYLIGVLLIEFTKKIHSNPIKIGPDTAVIMNSPFSIGLFDSDVIRIIMENNIEWKFHEEEVGRNFITKWLVRILKDRELECLKKADYIFCLNKKDMETIIDEGIKKEKAMMWIPQSSGKSRIKGGKGYSGRFVVGYLGSNFKPNIIAVKTILKLAEEIPEAEFLILGEVSGAFKGQDIPENVVMTGYVDDLDCHLSCCDIFINPKTTSDTGAEVKMLDYLRHSRKIIATEIGARGFEGEKNVIICGPGQMKTKIRELIGGSRGNP